jgi:redox-sensitive bicupin YhaK (pirin superfamily)
MLQVRRSAERGHSNHGWLDSRHTFSFGDYFDPSLVGFGVLRVINEDHVQAGAGFATHGHKNMEIISYVLEGTLAHKDSLGNGSIIRPGDVQCLTAGTGVQHSEFNHSASEPVHFLQIWIDPDQKNLRPSYQQNRFEDVTLRGRLRVVASPDGREGSVVIHQNAQMYAARLAEGETVQHVLAPGRKAYVQVTRGTIEANGVSLSAGDGAAITGEQEIRLSARDSAEVLLFDLV